MELTNLVVWYSSSSSHTLIGGFAGAGIAHAGLDAVNSDIVLKPQALFCWLPL
jgi:PiT family inorganic phosphate transporter